MDRTPVSDPDLAKLGTFQGTIDRNANFRQQAFDHNLGRNVRVAKLLGYLALLRQRGVAMSGLVDCVAAVRQNFSSSRSLSRLGLPTGPMEAAHFLPGQVRIGGREIWRLAADPKTRGHIEFLFAEVEHLPATFNQADSAAEAKAQAGGLCAALADACATLIRCPAGGRRTAGKVASDLVQPAYEEWHRQAMKALTDARAAKQEKPGLPPLVGDRFEGYTPESIAAQFPERSTPWNRDESLRILEYYLEDQAQRGWPWVLGTCQWALREVELDFKG